MANQVDVEKLWDQIKELRNPAGKAGVSPCDPKAVGDQGGDKMLMSRRDCRNCYTCEIRQG